MISLDKFKETKYNANNWPKLEVLTDDNVSKLVFTNDNAVAEAVLYRYPTFAERTVICCSTQSGCPVGCRFCGAGDHFVRSLTEDEIFDQVKACLDMVSDEVDSKDIKKLQIMFMSMGEPFLNLKNLVPTMERLHKEYPNARLLVSTSGPKISETRWDDFMNAAIDIPTIGLQFSIHETDVDKRNELIPFEHKMSFEEILEKGSDFLANTHRKPFFNYCAHDENSSEENAEQLAELFPPEIFCATVSVICERNEGMPATNEHQRNLATEFGNKLLAKGFDVRVFDPAGQDSLGAGCGQLWFVQRWFENNKNLVRDTIGNGKPSIHVPQKYYDAI